MYRLTTWQPISYKVCQYHPFAVTKNLLCSACLCWEHVVTCAYFLFPLKHFLRYSDSVRAVSRIFQLIHSFAAICGWLCCCPCMACQYSPGNQRYLVMFFKKIHYRGLALSELTLTYQFVYLTMFSLCSRLKLLFNEGVKRMRLF